MKLIKKTVSILMALVLFVGILPMGSIKVNAATENATLSNLGELGTVKIGNKSESGTWFQTQISERPVFCMDLGLACHSGDTYKSTEEVYSSDSSNKKKALEAKIGYWYASVKNKSRKAWVYAQCLMWAAEEGVTSESELKDIIKQVKNNTGYYQNETVYGDIFDIKDIVKCKVIRWNYSGSGASRQVLLEIEGKVKEYHLLKDTLAYRQRITIYKTDENGNPVTHVPFELQAKNYKELHSFKVNGWGSAETGDADGDSVFEAVAETDSTGKITYKFNYLMHSKDYGYVNAAELEGMTSAEKKAIKDSLDDEDIKYASDLTKAGAQKLIDKDFETQLSKINNKYVIKEINSGNPNMVVNTEYKNGKTIIITSDNSWTKNKNGEWPEAVNGTYENYSKATKFNIVNEFKKASVKVVKNDSFAADSTAHGEASLDGAEFKLFSDSACTKAATVYDSAGKTKTAGTYTVKNGTFTTDYLRAGVSYYLKETKAPEGYLLNTKVETVRVDGEALKDIEFTPTAKTIEVKEAPKLGKVEIFKVMSDGESGTGEFENKAEFQLYLKSKGSYEKADEFERDLLITDEKGYAISKDLYVGTYILHQTGSGDFDTIFVPDMEIEITENGAVKTYSLTNKPFKAHLKLIKKDGNTQKTVLKPNTSYEIYKVEADGREVKVVQSSGGVTLDSFITDESGEIMTIESLRFGTYRIYETGSAEGLFIKDKFMEFEVNSKLDNYEIKTDADGNSYALITLEYINYEAKGKVTIEKTGERLQDFATVKNDNLNTGGFFDEIDMPMVEVTDKQFNYKEQYLKGQVFEVYALEDIVTQDNQGTNWFNAGDKAAVITTGLGAEFTSECNGICTYTLNNDTGAVTITLPLGKYEVKEESTLHGFVVPETNRWELEFNWENADTEFVLNSTNVTDENGVLHIKNDRAKAEVNLIKKDADVETGVADAVFGFYTKDNIYNAEGVLIAEASELLKTVTTDKDGKARLDLDLPLMSEGYSMDEGADNTGLNSGDYYFKEQDISASYYLDEEPVYIHLEYLNDKTPVIKAEAVKTNKQTYTEIGKLTLAGSVELPNCDMQIKDILGNEIINWTSGVSDSITITEKAEELGYKNIVAVMNEDGNILINGLLHDEEYTLIETKPCDGYATAENIVFKLQQGVNEQEETVTNAFVKDTEGNFVQNEENKILMYDDTIKVEFSKTAITGEDEVPGNELSVIRKSDNVEIENWTSTDERYIIDGKLIAGETYILKETKPCDGYVTADDIEFTVEDTGEIQLVSMKDDITKIEFSKLSNDTKELIGNAKIGVFNDKGKKVYEFTTQKGKTAKIEGKLVAGNTYTFRELQAPEGFEKASDVKLTVKDSGEIQKVTMTDKRIILVPKTGIDAKPFVFGGFGAVFFMILAAAYIKANRRKKSLIETK